jgi:hypothetical protein
MIGAAAVVIGRVLDTLKTRTAVLTSPPAACRASV